MLVGDIAVVSVNTVCRLDWPVRTLSFSYDGRMLASASEDLVIDIADVDTGDALLLIIVSAPVCCLITCNYAVL